jgi:beta-glucosidase
MRGAVDGVGGELGGDGGAAGAATAVEAAAGGAGAGAGSARGAAEAERADIEARIARLTLEQKVRLLSGESVFRIAGEPAAGLRAMVTSDGPIGVRGERWDERDTAVALPSATAMAATWDAGLVERLGGVLAAEARRKGVSVLLAPTLNLHRSPAGGRHFECFSEDPLLTAGIGAAYIRGVQGGGVAATAKHYVANDSETDRLTLDARVDARTLREVYMAPFEAAVRAGVWVVMSAYNAVNGTTMSESALLAEPLKGEWGFDGVLVSDWGAVRSTVASAASVQDLAMPGPNEHWGAPLVAAVRDGSVSEAAVDEKLRRIFHLAARVGALDAPSGNGAVQVHRAHPSPVPDPRSGESVRQLLRRAVAAGSVLLRNEGGLLPLSPGSLRKVAVIGPNAATARIQGGGSASVFPSSTVSPLAGIRAALDGVAQVEYEAGAHISVRPTPLVPAGCTDPVTGEPGVRVRYLDADGAEVHTEHRLSGRVLEPTVDFATISHSRTVEVSARMVPETGGAWRIGVVGLGAINLRVDGETLLDEVVVPESDDPTYVHVAPSFRQAVVEARADVPLDLVARRSLDPGAGLAVALTADPPRRDPDDELAAAVELAKGCDAAVVVVGTTAEIESEGFDRASLALPGRQDELVAAVAAVNPRTVVIVNAGGPVLLPWREDVAAVLLSWFPGQEAGDGLADVLFGAEEPGGRLPTTWGAAEADVPILDTVPRDGVLDYAEGLHIGYRAWLKADPDPGADGRRAEPMYWFGHGLGYTAWQYDGVAVPEEVGADEPFAVEVTLRNTGERPGREVVQVYLARAASAVERPVRWLAGHAAVQAAPGEAVTARIEIQPRALQHWSVARDAWLTEPGGFAVLAGRSAADLPLATAIAVRD